MSRRLKANTPLSKASKPAMCRSATSDACPVCIDTAVSAQVMPLPKPKKGGSIIDGALEAATFGRGNERGNDGVRAGDTVFC